MTTTPNFDDLTPPKELMREWDRKILPYHAAVRWGARHGWEQARQLWPEPITDRPPTEADGDEGAYVQACINGRWVISHWRSCGHPWQHTSRWQPRQPSLQEQAIAALHRACTATDEDRALIRRALEQAGEGQA